MNTKLTDETVEKAPKNSAKRAAYGRALIFPRTEAFSVKTLATLNKEISAASVRNKLQKHIQNGEIAVSGNQPQASKGRPILLYVAVNKPIDNGN